MSSIRNEIQLTVFQSESDVVTEHLGTLSVSTDNSSRTVVALWASHSIKGMNSTMEGFPIRILYKPGIDRIFVRFVGCG
jgi:hypothetical protein